MKIIILTILLLNLYGCSGTIATMKDPSLTEGCSVTEAGVKLGYLNQEGSAEVCVFKCSDNIPENLKYTYNNPATGCNISIRGNKMAQVREKDFKELQAQVASLKEIIKNLQKVEIKSKQK